MKCIFRNCFILVLSFTINFCFFNDGCPDSKFGEVNYNDISAIKLMSSSGALKNQDGIVIFHDSNSNSGIIMEFGRCKNDTCWLDASKSYGLDKNNPRKWDVFFAGSIRFWYIDIANKSDFSYRISENGCAFPYSATNKKYAYYDSDSLIVL